MISHGTLIGRSSDLFFCCQVTFAVEYEMDQSDARMKTDVSINKWIVEKFKLWNHKYTEESPDLQPVFTDGPWRVGRLGRALLSPEDRQLEEKDRFYAHWCWSMVFSNKSTLKSISSECWVEAWT